MNKIHIIINGEAKSVDSGFTVNETLKKLGMPTLQVAIEHNGSFLEFGDADRVEVRNGDKLEVVSFVGGG